jgi:hypothetical protein
LVTRFDSLTAGSGLAGLEGDFTGFDVVVVANFSTSNILNPEIGVGGVSFTDRVALRLGGFSRDAAFGGSGDVSATWLSAGAVYAFLVPESAASLSYAALGLSGMEGDITGFADGQTVYLVPEPGPTLLALLGGFSILLRRRPSKRA